VDLRIKSSILLDSYAVRCVKVGDVSIHASTYEGSKNVILLSYKSIFSDKSYYIGPCVFFTLNGM